MLYIAYQNLIIINKFLYYREITWLTLLILMWNYTNSLKHLRIVKTLIRGLLGLLVCVKTVWKYNIEFSTVGFQVESVHCTWYCHFCNLLVETFDGKYFEGLNVLHIWSFHIVPIYFISIYIHVHDCILYLKKY